MKKRSLISLLATALIAVLMLCACGGKEVTVTIQDQKTSTEITTKVGTTVEAVLAEAGVSLGEKDEVNPAADSKIAEDTSTITISRYSKVTVVYDGNEIEVELNGGTVADALKAAGVTLADGEGITYSNDELLVDGMRIEVTRNAQVTLVDGGKSSEISTAAKTVDELLKEQGLTLGAEDTITPAADSEIKTGDTITITRVTYKELSEEEEIVYDTEFIYTDEYAEGYSEVTTPGVSGTKKITYKVRYVDEKEESREVVSEEVVVEPVNAVVTVGTYVEPIYEEPDYSYDDNSGGAGGVYEVSRTDYPSCADGSHGYTEIVYSDGSVEYVVY